MSNFITLFKRFVPPYKKYVVLSLFLNLFSTIFSLFSFAAIIPVLRILFKIDENTVNIYREWSWNDGLTNVISALKNNVFYAIEQMIQLAGPNMALLYLGLFLIVMTAFKVGTSYFGSYFMIPIRMGVVRDLRNQLYKKIVSLQIGFFSEERKGDIKSRMMNDVNEVEISIMS